MTEFWIHKPRVLIDGYDDFFPSTTHQGYQLYNALTRFALYLLIGLGMFNRDTTWAWALLFMVTFLGVIYPRPQPAACRAPTYENPMMNPLLFDARLELEACDNVDREADRLLLEGVKEDRWVLNRNKNVRRAFVTMAESKYPNDARRFAKALYDVDREEGCKTKNKNCKTYSDVRFYR